MGCCISKCKPQHNNIKNVVQDKLVISQQISPPIPSPIISPNNPHHHHHRFPPPSKYKISPSPASPTSSSSVSSFTCTAATTAISSSSSSSLSSASSFTSKDRSFSNEFLWSCYKDNPQITRINSLTHHHAASSPSFSNNQKPNKTAINPSPPPTLLNHRLAGSCSQKRLRSNSPTNLTRQKSFRKDSSQQQPQLESNTNRPLRMLIGSSPSPSPSRRFTDNSSSMDKTTSIVSKRRNNNNGNNYNNSPKVISSVHHHSCSRCSTSNSLRSSNKAASPNNSSLGRLQCSSGLRHRAMTRTLRVGSKIDENVVKQVVSNANNNDMELDLIEDIDNPLISLDCFIFL